MGKHPLSRRLRKNIERNEFKISTAIGTEQLEAFDTLFFGGANPNEPLTVFTHRSDQIHKFLQILNAKSDEMIKLDNSLQDIYIFGSPKPQRYL